MTPDLARDALWPSNSRSTTAAAMLLLPSKQPRLVLPADRGRGAREVARALHDGSAATARMRRAAVQTAAWVGFRSQDLPSPPLFEAVLSHLPPGDYVYGVHFGPPRANRKPVMAIANRDGEVVAFAKVGVDTLTDDLVSCEAAALGSLPAMSSVDAPRVVATGQLDGHPYSVMTPVAHSDRRVADAKGLVARAQVEVATANAGTGGIKEYAERTVSAWQARGEPAAAQSWALAAVPRLPQGAWHGDWRRTNMSLHDNCVSLWDWERFDSGVPLGYDALHLHLTETARSVDDLSDLPRKVHESAAALLQPFGYTSADDVDLVVFGYLLELASRYLDDDQLGAGARLGDVQRWLLPYVRRGLGLSGSGEAGA